MNIAIWIVFILDSLSSVNQCLAQIPNSNVAMLNQQMGSASPVQTPISDNSIMNGTQPINTNALQGGLPNLANSNGGLQNLHSTQGVELGNTRAASVPLTGVLTNQGKVNMMPLLNVKDNQALALSPNLGESSADSIADLAVNPCKESLIACFEMITKQMKRTEQLLDMANKSLASSTSNKIEPCMSSHVDGAIFKNVVDNDSNNTNSPLWTASVADNSKPNSARLDSGASPGFNNVPVVSKRLIQAPLSDVVTGANVPSENSMLGGKSTPINDPNVALVNINSGRIIKRRKRSIIPTESPENSKQSLPFGELKNLNAERASFDKNIQQDATLDGQDVATSEKDTPASHFTFRRSNGDFILLNRIKRQVVNTQQQPQQLPQQQLPQQQLPQQQHPQQQLPQQQLPQQQLPLQQFPQQQNAIAPIPISAGDSMSVDSGSDGGPKFLNEKNSNTSMKVNAGIAPIPTQQSGNTLIDSGTMLPSVGGSSAVTVGEQMTTNNIPTPMGVIPRNTMTNTSGMTTMNELPGVVDINNPRGSTIQRPNTVGGVSPLLSVPLTSVEKTEVELESAPDGLILVVKEPGQSILKVGDLVDGNLNPVTQEDSKSLQTTILLKEMKENNNGQLNSPNLLVTELSATNRMTPMSEETKLTNLIANESSNIMANAGHDEGLAALPQVRKLIPLDGPAAPTINQPSPEGSVLTGNQPNTVPMAAKTVINPAVAKTPFVSTQTSQGLMMMRGEEQPPGGGGQILSGVVPDVTVNQLSTV